MTLICNMLFIAIELLLGNVLDCGEVFMNLELLGSSKRGCVRVMTTEGKKKEKKRD